jgi:large subunit ribosomal protein L18Ae
VRQFFVIGRGLPSEKTPNPTLYRMRVFAKNPVLAKSKFWYHMKRQHKVRKVQGEIVSVQEIYEKHAGVVKNYGIVLRYLSRTETINMYKEYRDTTLAGAVSQMCKSSYLTRDLAVLHLRWRCFPLRKSEINLILL